MSSAYVDSSCFVALALNEVGCEDVADRLRSVGGLYAGTLVDAEVRAAMRREGARVDLSPILGPIKWVYMDRHLSAELERVFAAGYVRGADAWHLACALALSPNPKELAFITLDARQAEVAKALGFAETGATP